MSEQYLTSKQAAEILGVHVETLYRWHKEGKLVGYILHNGRRRYLATQLDQYMKAGENK